ncbi:dihydroxyacetone kinase subunit DhaL [Rhizobium sp. AP16]|uniref:dihydroxyacetone kinase subunit DhaL n=1 Tax=Rhizobium sp. AP16 TaxID=1144306 RepID=UPI00026ECC3E|nr:dihydroxyacetone kinase subunit DhaL [Rhizobium sp. AP16]EJK81263.1 dihydroxyacetone kinase, phosphoprotein-dependent, L subunit [Rhizobium sp. AP16]
MTTITADDLKSLIALIAEAMTRERDRLCELDGVIGDADHGIAMELGFSAAAKATAELDPATADPTLVFNTAAKAFLNAVGASSGPLYATGLMRAGAAVKGKPSLTADDMVGAFAAIAKGIQDRGKAEVGEKTMIDAWAPAAAACQAARDQGMPLGECFSAALVAAQTGMDATKDMIATKGRSSRLGERALGHIDPGAASTTVVVACFHAFFSAQ